MNPSALIFVALAVAWAVYLIPKALEHHEAGERSRSISNFSHRLRVLGRRDAVSRDAALAADGPPATVDEYVAARGARPDDAAPPAAARQSTPSRASAAEARRASVVRATRRRRRVLGLILILLAAAVATAVMGYVGRPWVAVPVVVLVAWLVACRVMVRKEHAVAVRRSPAGSPPSAPPPSVRPSAAPAPSEPVGATSAPDVGTERGAPSTTDVADSAVGRWDPVDVPLPTYVSKPAAVRRTVRTIDLESTGVWSSGRNEADSALAREAEASRQSERTSQNRVNRRTGS